MRCLLNLLAVGATILSAAVPAAASDHADPIDNPLFFWKKTPLEGGITDLFVFPDKGGTQLIVILCVRRSLTGKPANLDQYEYSVFMDLDSKVNHDNSQNNARYGGTVVSPKDIAPSTTLTFRLKSEGETREKPTILGTKVAVPKDDISVWGDKVDAPRRVANWGDVSKPNDYSQDQAKDWSKVNVWTGISDDPFIFPNFFLTNVVSMVTSIPMKYFPPGQKDWIVWATSKKGDEQIDHVGRSLRTQNPRFERLNTLPPSQHVAAIEDEMANPSVMRDIFVWLGINGLFGFRNWDKVPDVMLFTLQPGITFGEYEAKGADGKPIIKANMSDGMNASFPNGRFLTDDVADRLARYGDTLLKELSYVVAPCQNPPPPMAQKPECSGASWPRRTTNDKLFQGQQSFDQVAFDGQFPYLAAPWMPPDARLMAPPLTLHSGTVTTLAIIAVVIVLLWLATAWLLAAWIDYRRQQRRYL